MALWGKVSSVCDLPAGKVIWLEKDWEEGTGKHLAVVVPVLFAAPAPVSALRGRGEGAGSGVPQKGHRGLSLCGMKQETLV